MTAENFKIGLIGAGYMGTAIAAGLIRKDPKFTTYLWVYDKIEEKAASFAEAVKIQKASSAKQIAEESDVIILAVKPQDLAAIAEEIKGSLKTKALVISILAGTPILKLETLLDAHAKQVGIVRAMPNLGAQVGAAMTAITASHPDLLGVGEMIFVGCGRVVRLEEKYFDLVTAVSGSGPAYFFHLMELMAKEAEQQGIAAKDARLLAVQTALGAALLAASSEETPGELRQKVTSKGGTTEAALKVFEAGKFPEIVHKAILAAQERGRQLAEGK